MTPRDGFPRFSARSAGRGDAGHRKPFATLSKSLGKPSLVARANRRQVSKGLDDTSSAAAALPLRRVDAPQGPRLPSDPPDGPPDGPSDRLRDLYGSLSTLLGISWPAP